MAHHFGQRGHRANLEPVAGRTHAAQFLDLAQIDDHFGPLDPILEPVKAVQPAGQHPGLCAVPGQQGQRVIDRRGLKEFERWHYVMNDSHFPFSSFLES